MPRGCPRRVLVAELIAVPRVMLQLCSGPMRLAAPPPPTPFIPRRGAVLCGRSVVGSAEYRRARGPGPRGIAAAAAAAAAAGAGELVRRAAGNQSSTRDEQAFPRRRS